ncbi:MFS transporter [Hymenobacter sp. ASUV-10]|uniref:MFS transporter n=1 Tax=Hymenobacter aranciens TaxID=3063996 RepID=A0ABT9BD91_9BACT|nr:MFS transporter [Hymenobacter sp. ASUV-10]MDO7876224.1 MFS transporter [Hymenobacter sp. ASUV-10]
MSSKQSSIRALALLNLFLADVRDGVGPYLAIYLLTVRHWTASSIGVAMALPGLVAVLLQTPAGSLVDTSRHKRTLLVLASAVVGLCCVAAVMFRAPAVIYLTQGLIGAATTLYAPVVAAITLGLVGHRLFAGQAARNEGWNHGGNVLAAVLAGLIGYYWRYEGIFYLVALMCVLGSLAALRIRPADIDDDLARGLTPAASAEADASPAAAPASSWAVLREPRLLRFAVAVVLFHFANAAMLPLVGQKLALGNQQAAALFMSACIVAAQLVMIPVAAWVGRRVPTAPRKPVFLLAFAVLPVRGILYTLSANAYYLVGVQLLDGIGAGIFGVISVIMIADLTRGTGRFNFVQGAITTALGIGAGLSMVLSGFLVGHFGYRVGFLTLAAVALVALVFFWRCVAETSPVADDAAGASVADDKQPVGV